VSVDDTDRQAPVEERLAALTRAAAVARRVVAARGYRIPAHEREDVLQEAMLQLWRALSSPAAREIRSVEAFATTVAHRSCLLWLRRRSRPVEPVRDPAENTPSAEERMLEREHLDLALRVVRRLRPGCKEILRLHVLDRRSYREIATLLNRSEHGLRTQMCDCLQQARRILEQLRRDAAS
jgi:RNA polymerase sigma factor (sigma-70 family)